MNFKEEDISFYVDDLQELISEFEKMDPEDRQDIKSLEEDARSIIKRLQNIDELDEEEEEQLHEDIDELYDFLDDMEEEFGDDELDGMGFELDEDLNLDQITKQIETVLDVLEQTPEIDAETIESFQDEMNQFFDAMKDTDQKDNEKIQELQNRFIAIQKKHKKLS